MTFLLAEDEALRKKLQGITVYDQKSDSSETIARTVGVWFGQPDQELRNQSFPYITIDMVDIQRDFQREMRALSKPQYLEDPTEIDGETYDPELHSWEIELPIPVMLSYQITVYSRHPRHDREILAQLLTRKFPLRFGQLDILEHSKTVGDTTTNTWTLRRVEVTNVVKRDVTEQAKRLFINAISVRVSSEVVQEVYANIYKTLEIKIDTPTIEPVVNPLGRTVPYFDSLTSISITE